MPLFATSVGTVLDLHNLLHGFKARLPEELGFTLYRLRHTFATRAAAAGWPLAKLAAYLGHSPNSLAVTMKYYVSLTCEQVGAPPVAVTPAAIQ